MTQKRKELPDEIVLDVPGMRVSVEEGQKVGTTLRNIAFLNGHSKDEARRIHREQVQFHAVADGIELEVLGENPTVLDGESLSQGDRVEVTGGETLELSGVLEGTIRFE